jgi:putative nucleotidyltransferase with HDIG domain
MKHILFVDDEPNVLEGLKRMLRSQRSQWEVSFAQGGEAALALLDASPFDVVVSDMRMPGVDGATLLNRVREQHPDIIRIILSGHTELAAAFRAIPVAHQFLLKPCDPDALRVSIGRATSLFDVLNSKTLASIVGSMKELPALPRTYAALQEALVKDDVSLDKVARIVEQDVAISAKILQLVNSAFFGVVRNIATVRTAVSYLGVNVLQQLVLSAEVFRVFQDSERIPGFSPEALYAHSQRTARIAGKLQASKHLPDAAIVAALLHDVGKLVLATRMPAEFSRALAMAREQKRDLHEVEQEILGVSHAEVGAYLLGLWGLPCIIVEAVANHHNPRRVPHQSPDAITAVHVADVLAHECGEQPHEAEDYHSPLDMEYLEELGVAGQLPEWKQIAQAVAGDSAGA